jgi:hypothetical protein
MERYVVYQFCHANYDDRNEFLSRIKRFLDAYQKGMGDIKDHYMLESYFENDELLFIDIVPSIFSKVIHDFELLSENDIRDLYPIIKEITEKFEDEFTEALDSRLDSPTLVIKFRRLTKLISKEEFEAEGTPFNYRASK